MKIWRPVALLVAMFVPLSCTYGDQAYSSATTIKSLPHRSPRERLDFFFGDEKPGRAYLQVALIEAVGGTYTADDELLVRLKHEAALCGADAVIGIRKGSQTRESGALFCKGCKHAYGATVFSGIAVVYRDRPTSPAAANAAQRSPK